VATECIGKKIGRVRFKIITDASTENLLPFVEDNIEYGSEVITDGTRDITTCTFGYFFVEKVD
jgi:phosphoenolpyruvate synthase/pyruvate phosphate dikinase